MKAFQKDSWRGIWHSMGRFVAIFAIVALGVGFFAGLKATSPDMQNTADEYYDRDRLLDVRVISTLGLTDEDIAYLSSIEGVGQVCGQRSLDVLVAGDGGNRAIRLHSLPEEGELDQVTLLEGRLPEVPGEIAVEGGMLDNSAYSVGSVITLSESNEEDSLDSLKTHTFTVTGVVSTPRYISFQRGNTTIGDGSISLYAYVPGSTFDMDYYTEAAIAVTGAREAASYSDEYDEMVQAVVDRLEDVADERAGLRLQSVLDEANQELQDAKDELAEQEAEADEKLAEAKDKIDQANLDIADGEQKLKDGEQEIEDGQEELDSQRARFNREIKKAGQKLEDAEAEADAAGAELAAQEETLAASEAGLQSAKDQLDQSKAGLDQLLAGIAQAEAAGQAGQAAALQAQYDEGKAGYDTALAQYNEGLAALDSGKAQLEQGRKQLEEARKQIEAGKAELAAQRRTGQKALDEAEQELADGRIELEDGRAELEEAKQELADGQKEYDEKKAEADEKIADAHAQIADAEEALAELDECEWYVLDRGSLPGFAGFVSDTERIDHIAQVFPVFFFLVAALVCLTTMTRMVEEQRGQIGTFKALGYSKLAIAGKYMLYAMLATVAGCALGLAVGFQVFPKVIWGAYGIMYDMPPIIAGFNWKYALISSLAALLCTGLSTYFACASELASTPAQLMRPKAPKAGKRILLERIKPLWRRMNFSSKVTARNLFRYKKRLFMTVIGIAGCTALLLTGFGLRDSIVDIVPRQFGDIFVYDGIAAMKEEDPSPQGGGLDAALAAEDGLNSYLYYSQRPYDASAGDAVLSDVYAFVPQNPGELDRFIHLKDLESGEILTLPDEGVILTEKVARRMGLSVGGILTLSDGAERYELPVAGVVENYVYNYVYMTPALYEKTFGEPVGYDKVLLDTAETTEAFNQSLSERMLAIDGISGTSFMSTIQDEFEDIFSSLNFVVVVLIVSAALLAFVVLYNLTNINITERVREIATIKVLGFYDREVSSYVYRENIWLTLFGTLLGLVLGIFLHSFVVQTAEVDVCTFVRQIMPLSYVYSAAMTFLFAGLVNWVMHFRLRRIDMVESLKAIE